MDNEHLKYGLWAQAQRTHRLEEITDCGTPSPTLPPRGGGRGWGGLRTPNSPSPSPLPKGERVWVSGMTLIEVIVVMIIIGILAAVALPKIDLGGTTSRASVEGAANMIASDIRYAQECAMANRVTKSVVFTSGQSIYTFPATTPSTSGLDPSGRLPSGVTIATTITFTFNSLGEPTSGGGSSVMVSGGGQTKTISVVNYTGKVNIS